MKNFEFLLCFLCVLPCAFAKMNRTSEAIESISRSSHITTQDFLDCLNRVETDWNTIFQLSGDVLDDDSLISQENVTKVGCFLACICKKNGVLANSKIIPDRVINLAPLLVEDQRYLTHFISSVKGCSEQVSNKTNDCDIAVSFYRCIAREITRQT